MLLLAFMNNWDWLILHLYHRCRSTLFILSLLPSSSFLFYFISYIASEYWYSTMGMPPSVAVLNPSASPLLFSHFSLFSIFEFFFFDYFIPSFPNFFSPVSVLDWCWFLLLLWTSLLLVSIGGVSLFLWFPSYPIFGPSDLSFELLANLACPFFFNQEL